MGKPDLPPYHTVPGYLWRAFSSLSPPFHPMPWPSCNYRFKLFQTPSSIKLTPCPSPATHPHLWAVTNTSWVPSFLAANEGWPRAGNGRLPAFSGTFRTLPARAAPCLHRGGQRALPPHTQCAGRLLPEDAGVLGVGEDGDGDCLSTILGLGRPHPHSGCTRASWNSRRGGGAALGEHASASGPLTLRAPGAAAGDVFSSASRASAVGSPASPRSRQQLCGLWEGAGRETAPESQSL